MDHDFLKGDGRERPFAPPPEQPILRWLGALLTVLALVYAGYRVIEWMNYLPPAAPTKPAPYGSSRETRQASVHPPQTSIPSAPDPETLTITKCVINGKTSYGDGSCAGGVTTQITTKTNHNLMAAVRPQAPVQTEEPVRQPITVTKDEPISSAMETKARCEALEAKIASLDAMGRQPQSPQTHDWIRDERKKARDERFRIPCK